MAEGEDERFEISYRAFALGYFAILGLIIAAAILASHFFGVNIYRFAFVSCGVMFLLAGIGKPRLLYLIVRNTGWFAFISDPLLMRLLLLGLGALSTVLGLFVPASQVESPR